MRVWMIGHVRGLRTSWSQPCTTGVETLVDVRHFLGSRRNPKVTQASLAAELQSAARTCANEAGDLLILMPGRA
jgi:hypothetical protein